MSEFIDVALKFIGKIHTPYQSIDDCPCNIIPEGPLCKITLDKQYQDALLGLKAKQMILIMYWLDEADRSVIKQTHKENHVTKGTFALRTPHRPNPIGVAVLPIQKIEHSEILVRGLDCMNGTKLIDIKPAMTHEFAS